MTTIESITASYTVRGIFGKLEEIETSAEGAWITKRLITKLVAGFFRPYWEQGHVNFIRATLSDGREVWCVQKAVQGVKQLEVTVWDADNQYSKDVSILPAKVVSADLREMVLAE